MHHVLPEFQKFMTERNLAPKNQIPFYAYWADKFIRFCNERHATPSELKVQLFLDDLKKDPKLQDWQVAQARKGRP